MKIVLYDHYLNFLKFQLKQNKKKKTNWNCLQSLTNRSDEELRGYHIFLEDGTEVDDEDYFQMLQPQSLLIVSEQSKMTDIFKIESSKHYSAGK